MKNGSEKTDQKLRELLKPGLEQKAPEGFTSRVMQSIQAETENQTYSIRDFLKEYFPYIAGTLVLIGIMLVNWKNIPWFSGVPADQPADVERNIRLIQSWMQGFNDVISLFSSSTIGILFLLAVLLYFAADRVLNAYFNNRRSSAVHMII